ncbi:MAG: hypothetical protein NTX50_28255 [Candidatus Sumerlaeota bacterium]|nr:hypothetical protein [Candidatus Sumerlaeota bacterium]
MKKIKLAIVGVLCLGLAGFFCASSRADQLLPYKADFESPAYTVGPVNSQNGWVATDPTSATVQTSIHYEGAAALEILPGGAVDQAFSAADNIVWVDGYHSGQPSDDLPDVTQISSGSALVAFTATTGVLCYDGVLQTWRAANVILNPSAWYRVTLKLNFTTNLYDCYVNSKLKLAGVGFLLPTSRLNGFQAAAGPNSSYLDLLRVQASMPNGLAPYASIADYLLGKTSDPTGLDANEDTRIDSGDIRKTMNMQQ